jgi:uncharacterized protein (UPF0261 family)/ABC-type branched-subunit amino acid transport system ATPase component
MAERQGEQNGWRRQSRASEGLQVRGLHVYYGQSHALQGVDLTLTAGVHAVVGRNGMGKTTLCNAIMGLVPARSGSIRFHGQELTRIPSYQIAACGIGYTPQGRRLWPSLTVDEHLHLVDSGGAWNVERIYNTFPRLAERRRNGAGQLSGGEQQMLAISRALLQDPELLVLDEPTEGLAPVIVDQVEKLLAELAAERDVSILLIEQNISVATAIADDVAIMVNGRIRQVMPAAELARDRTLQERLLGVGRHSHEDIVAETTPAPVSEKTLPIIDGKSTAGSDGERVEAPADEEGRDGSLVYVPPTRWSSAAWRQRDAGDLTLEAEATARPFDDVPEPLYREPVRRTMDFSRAVVLVAGTFDTKGEELRYLRDCIADQGVAVKTVDLSTSGKPSSADVPPYVVAGHHPAGSGRVFSGERGSAVRAMAEAFEHWLGRQDDVAGVISAAGSGGTALVTPAMRRLSVGVPKVMISTVASGDVAQYVGASDIMMMYSVTDVQGLNRISRRVLANGANAIAGMVADRRRERARPRADSDKPGVGVTMFGVTTTAVQQVTRLIEDRYDCLVFHATGTGGRSMEKLADSGMLVGALDITTTEICDMMMGGVFAADEDRFGAFIRTGIPWVGSVGALDMVNFGPRDTVPEKYRARTFVEHNPQVTLMRTTADENRRMGEWIANRINRMDGPVRFLIPEGGVSALDAPGQPFQDPEADRALFEAIVAGVRETANRRLHRLPCHINDPAFAQAAVDAFETINPMGRNEKNGTI